MGLFDEVSIVCQKCGAWILEQTKAGDCTMAVYALEDAPAEILADLEGDMIECTECEYMIRIRMIVKAQAIAY